MFTNATNKFCSLVMTSLADVDRFNLHSSIRVAGLSNPDIDSKTHPFDLVMGSAKHIKTETLRYCCRYRCKNTHCIT